MRKLGLNLGNVLCDRILRMNSVTEFRDWKFRTDLDSGAAAPASSNSPPPPSGGLAEEVWLAIPASEISSTCLVLSLVSIE